MTNNLAVIIYIAALFVLLLGIALAVLIISRKEFRTSQLYRTIVVFVIAVMVFCGLYLYFYFRDMILLNYQVPLPLRVFDYLLFGLIPLLWLRVIGLLDDNVSSQKSRIFVWSWVLGTAQALTGMAAACFMNPYYGFRSELAGTLYALIGCVLVLLIVCVTAFYTLRFFRASVSRLRSRYVGFVSLIFCLWLCVSQVVDTGLYLGRFISAWAEGIPDATAPSAFLMGLATLVFIFREDFSPLFYALPKADPPQPPAPKQTAAADDAAPEFDLLELAAAQHGLTVRELDVLRLVYEGKNNPEIAEALFISRNTVKKHLQNIYEKTGVNSRMELIYIVNLKS